MTALYIISFILFVVATVALLKLTPEQVGEDITVLFDRQQTLKDQSLTARGKKKKNKLLLSLERMRNALEETGKGKQFSAACAAALLLMVVGCITAIAIDNMFMIPVLAVAFAMIPFAYLAKTLSVYQSQVSRELETALSTVTASYIRSDNLVSAVQENLSYLKPPIKGIFESFIAEATVISPDIRGAIHNLKDKVKNSIFEEWCDTLISCQNDRTLKDTLMPVVSKLTDGRSKSEASFNKIATFSRPSLERNIPSSKTTFCLTRDLYVDSLFALPSSSGVARTIA